MNASHRLLGGALLLPFEFDRQQFAVVPTDFREKKLCLKHPAGAFRVCWFPDRAQPGCIGTPAHRTKTANVGLPPRLPEVDQ
jgi:hypothetical protein